MEVCSIVSFAGYHEGGHCGYCKGNEPLKATVGIWAHQLDVSHYNGLLDRGMRRSGKYVYKPIIEKTCCPQYTIRLDVHKFRLSRSQKKVLRQMNEFLMFDRRPQQSADDRIEKNLCKSKLSKGISKELSPKKGGFFDPNASEKMKKFLEKSQSRKKKFIRRERALERMRSKGIDVEEAMRLRAEAECARRRTVESFLSAVEPNKAVHKLEVELVRVGSVAFEKTEDESYRLYKKYQETIHKDEGCSRKGFESFLASSPLEVEDESSVYGTHHHQYRLDGKLIAVGVLDVLPRCVSSKYFFYDPDYKFLSLGTYAALREIAFATKLSRRFPELHYYYMGYYIESCPKMRYKSHFRPSDLLCDRTFTWVPFEDCKEELRKNDRVLVFAKGVPPPAPIPVGSVLCLYKRVIMKYSQLLEYPGFVEKEAYMHDYAALLGSLAQEILLYRS